MSEHPRSRQRANFIAYASAGLIVVVCLFSHLGAIGLVGPDEPRYAWIARAMATSGDWVTPRLYGQPWFEKPVLYYWAAALGFLAHLPVEWAARLPSAVAALVAAIAIGWLGWKFYGTESSPFASPFLIAPLIFSTSVAAIGFARAAGPDMLFSAALTLAMASGAIVLSRRGALRSENDNRASTGSSRSLRASLFRRVARACSSRKRPGGSCTRRRRDRNLGYRDEPVAQRAPPRSSDRNHRVLRGRIAVVRALRRAQSRLHPHIYFSAQFRAIPHAHVSASPAVLVFRPDSSARTASLDGVPLASAPRRIATLAAEILEQFAGILFRMLGYFPFFVFQLFAIETTRIYPSGHSSALLF